MDKDCTKYETIVLDRKDDSFSSKEIPNNSVGLAEGYVKPLRLYFYQYTEEANKCPRRACMFFFYLLVLGSAVSVYMYISRVEPYLRTRLFTPTNCTVTKANLTEARRCRCHSPKNTCK